MLHLYGYYIIPGGGDMSAVTDGDWEYIHTLLILMLFYVICDPID